MIKVLIGLVIFLSFLNLTKASEIVYDELTFSLGMASISYTENEKTIQGENVREAASGSVSAIVGNAQYKFSSNLKRAYYINASFPLINSGEGTYLAGGVGVEFYLSDLSSKFGHYDSGTQVILTPTLRYFWGGEAGFAYLVYNTESATKTDILLDLGLLGGASYVFSDKITVKATFALLKGTGAIASTFGMRALVGASFYYD